jgi:PhzF family phenazine biosynthesis protein
MQLPLYQVDAFSSRPFHGNPAAVIPLKAWIREETLQSVAMENNLSETAFFVKTGDRYHIRWFTPSVEVDLCGHATLASAHILMHILEPSRETVTFDSRSGPLHVRRDGERLALDFPARPPQEVKPGPHLLEALGGAPQQVFAARDYMVTYASEGEVRALKPDFGKLSMTDKFAVIATAPGENSDFVSRFFAPAQGIDEDPVTGSAHCTLIPYWSQRLGKQAMFARQVSAREGELWCELQGDRVKIAGHATLVLTGTLQL